MKKQIVYFDNASTTPVYMEVVEEMNRVNSEIYGNPSSTHSLGRKAKVLIEMSRKTIAEAIGAESAEIIFTSCGTESDNITIRNSIQHMGVQRIITSKIEHKAVLKTSEYQAHENNCKLDFVNLLDNGHIDFNHLEELLKTDSKTLVSLMHANNELGNLLDLEKTAELCQKYGALFHTDAVQTIGHINIDLKNVHIDFLASSAHKFNGPKGIGFLYVNRKHSCKKFMHGGGQERDRRPGTENIASIAGMAMALDISIKNLDKNKTQLQKIKTHFISELENNFKGVSFNGDFLGACNPTVLSVTLPPSDIDAMLLFQLDMKGICVSGGSACNSGANTGSYVMDELYPNKKGATIRFSFGHQNTTNEVDYVIEALNELLNKGGE